MRLQIATLALNDSLFINFSATLHDDVTAQQIKSGQDMKVYLRDRLSRLLRQHFGADRPGFFFVLEANDKIDQSPPYIHGRIRLPLISSSSSTISIKSTKKLSHSVPVEEIQKIMRVKNSLHKILKADTGNSENSSATSQTGLSHRRNVHTTFPLFPFQNSDWVSYTLKNATRLNADLPENRIALPHNLNR